MARPRASTAAPCAPDEPSPPPFGDWYDVNEMARRLRVSPVTVRRMVRRGDVFEPDHFGPGVTRWSAEKYRAWYTARARRA
jgi:hypothetical protein